MKSAFLSYSRSDNERSKGKICQLVSLINDELQSSLGSEQSEIFFDETDIKYSQELEPKIQNGLDNAVVLIPVISPTYLTRPSCRYEFEYFAEREKAIIARKGWKAEDRLILPLVYRELSGSALTDPIWLQSKKICFGNIEHLTDLHCNFDDKETTKFVKRIASRIAQLRQLVLDSERDEMLFKELDRDDGFGLSLREFSKPLLNWPTTLCNDEWIERPELEQLKAVIESNDSSCRFLTGAPGSGKSAILSRLCKHLDDDGFVVLGIKADKLPTNIETVANFSQLVTGENMDLVSELRRLAVYHKVVVVVDQLDALANLADLHSGRLNVMLDLIAQLRDCNGIHIVASARTYELNADQRLEGLIRDDVEVKSEVVELASLTSDKVRIALGSFSTVDCTNWPDSYFQFLSVPYHLSLFTKHLELLLSNRGEIPNASIFASIQQMHAAAFDATIETSLNREQLELALSDLSTLIEDSENLWQPVSKLKKTTEAHIAELKQLGWVIEQDGEIGFAHQTQFEFYRVRRFVAEPNKFVSYVKAREDGLFVRPAVWQGLSHLRELNPQGYAVAMAQLQARVSRLHLRRLFMEFLAEVNTPTPSEIGWVSSYLLSAEDGRTMCWLLRGKAGWFSSIPDEVLDELMTRHPDECRPVARLLQVSWPFGKARTCKMIRKNWAFRRDYAHHVWFIFAEASDFDNEMLTWLFFVAIESPEPSWWIQRCLKNLVQEDPLSTYEVARSLLNQRLDNALEEVEFDSEGNEPNYFEYKSERNLSAGRKAISEELSNDSWFVLGDISVEDPAGFVKSLWPWIIRAIEILPKGHQSRLRTFLDESGNSCWFDEGDGFPAPELIETLVNSIREWARVNPNGFKPFVVKHGKKNSNSVQRLLCTGVIELASGDPDFALAFFRNDSRRFLLGGHRMREDTWKLVETAIPHWNREQLVEFQELVIAWHMYHDEGTPEYMDQFRAELLCFVPIHQRTDVASLVMKKHNAHMEQERQRLADRGPSTMTKVVSPLMAETMKSMDSEQLLSSIRDSLNISNDAANVWRGRTGSLVMEEFSKFAKIDPERALQIVGMLQPNGHEQQLASAGLKGISESELELNEEILVVIRKLTSSQFSSQPFRDDIGQLLQRIAIDINGLPADICEMLASWLLNCPKINVQVPDGKEPGADAKSEQSPRSVLWQRLGTLQILPHQWFQIGEALKIGHCASEPSRAGEWLAVMHKCVELDFSTDVWSAWLSSNFRCDPCRTETAKFVVALLRARTDVLLDDIGIASIAMWARWMTGSDRKYFLDKLLSSKCERHRQGAGELAMFMQLRFDDPTSTKLVQEYLNGRDELPDDDAARIGIAFTAAHEWKDPDGQEECVNVLCQLMNNSNSVVHSVILTCFSRDQPLENDANTRQLLESIAKHICFSSGREVYRLVKLLCKFVNLNPKLTLKVVERLVAGFSRFEDNNRGRFGFFEDDLINIVLTLHRQNVEQLKTESLNLYEDLMRLEVTGAFERLRQLDHRPTS